MKLKSDHIKIRMFTSTLERLRRSATAIARWSTTKLQRIFKFAQVCNDLQRALASFATIKTRGLVCGVILVYLICPWQFRGLIWFDRQTFAGRFDLNLKISGADLIWTSAFWWAIWFERQHFGGRFDLNVSILVGDLIWPSKFRGLIWFDRQHFRGRFDLTFKISGAGLIWMAAFRLAIWFDPQNIGSSFDFSQPWYRCVQATPVAPEKVKTMFRRGTTPHTRSSKGVKKNRAEGNFGRSKNRNKTVNKTKIIATATIRVTQDNRYGT